MIRWQNVDSLLSLDQAPLSVADVPEESSDWMEGVCVACRRVYRFAPPETCLWCGATVTLPSAPSPDNVNQNVAIRRCDDGKWEGRERYATLSADNPDDLRHGKGFWRGCRCDKCNDYRKKKHREQYARRKNSLIQPATTVGNNER